MSFVNDGHKGLLHNLLVKEVKITINILLETIMDYVYAYA